MTQGPPSGASWEDRWSDLLLRLRLFAVSYAPLFLIFALRSVPSWTAVSVWTALAILFLADGYFIVSGSQRRNSRAVTIEDVRDKSSAVSGYVATYLLPFIAAVPSTLPEILAVVAFFVVVGAIYVKSDLALLNPTLYLYGWRVAEVTRNGQAILLVCRHLPSKRDSIEVVRWLNVYIEKTSRRERRSRTAV